MRISDWSSDVCSSDLVSLSIDSGEARLQRQGYVQAFRDRQVLEAITGGILGRIAVTYFEWANSAHTHMVVTWTFIDSAAAAEAFAAALEQRRPGPEHYTSISGAIDRSEEHTSELPSLMSISYAVSCLKKKNII